MFLLLLFRRRGDSLYVTIHVNPGYKLTSSIDKSPHFTNLFANTNNTKKHVHVTLLIDHTLFATTTIYYLCGSSGPVEW